VGGAPEGEVMIFKRVLEILEAEVIVDAKDEGLEILSVCNTDLMSDLLHFSIKPNPILITGLTNTQVVRTAEIADIKAIAFVLNKRPDEEVIELARRKDVPLIVTKLSKFTACGRLYVEGLRSCTEN